jgi:hypothetical protein
MVSISLPGVGNRPHDGGYGSRSAKFLYLGFCDQLSGHEGHAGLGEAKSGFHIIEYFL